MLTLFPKVRLSLLDGGHDHVSASCAWESIQPSSPSHNWDDIQILGSCVVCAIHDGTHWESQGHAELVSRCSSAPSFGRHLAKPAQSFCQSCAPLWTSSKAHVTLKLQKLFINMWRKLVWLCCEKTLKQVDQHWACHLYANPGHRTTSVRWYRVYQHLYYMVILHFRCIVLDCAS